MVDSSRRQLLEGASVAASSILLAGCTLGDPFGDTPTRTGTPTDSPTPTPEPATTDILISNARSEAVIVTIEFSPEPAERFELRLTVQVDAGEDVIWDETAKLDTAGKITASFRSESTNQRTADVTWPNDDQDTHTLYTEVDEDGIEATVWVE